MMVHGLNRRKEAESSTARAPCSNTESGSETSWDNFLGAVTEAYFVSTMGRDEACVASPTSGQKASVEMRDFELLRTSRRLSDVDEQTRTSKIYGRAEAGDFTRGGPARRDGQRGVPASCPLRLN